MGNMTEFQALGYERPVAANQIAGGSRAVGFWGCTIIGSLHKALADARLLDGLADCAKPGDHVFMASYEDKMKFRDEERAEIGQLLVLAVTKPPIGKRVGGRVSFVVQAYRSIAEELAKLHRSAA